MSKSKTTGKSSVHASTARGGKKRHAPDCESLVRFAETLKLRSLADATCWHLRCPHCAHFTLVRVGVLPRQARAPPSCVR